MPESQPQSSSQGGPFRWVVLAVVFFAALFVLKLAFGLIGALFKWAIIGAVALVFTSLVAKRLFGSRSE